MQKIQLLILGRAWVFFSHKMWTQKNLKVDTESKYFWSFWLLFATRYSAVADIDYCEIQSAPQ